MKAAFGRKLGMTQLFDQEGRAVPVTVVEVRPSTVVQVKNAEKDGYQALQVGFEPITKEGNVRKSQKGKAYRQLREIRTEETLNTGDVLDVSLFEEGDVVRIAGVSKGKGFQGGVKRWGFSGRNATHGVKHEERTLGSVGSQQPQRVLPGKKMPGHMGKNRVTVKGLRVVKVDAENSLLAVEGAVPGAKGTLLEIHAM